MELRETAAGLDVGRDVQNCADQRLEFVVHASTFASASEEGTLCVAESWRRNRLQFSFGHLLNSSLNCESEQQKTHPVLLQATGLPTPVPGTEQLSAGSWRSHLERIVSGLQHHLQLLLCLLQQCSGERGLSAPVSQLSPVCAEFHSARKHQ